MSGNEPATGLDRSQNLSVEDYEDGHVPQLAESSRLALPEAKARSLDQIAQALVSNLFEALVSQGRMELLEVACAEDSVHTATMQGLTKREESAARCSLWNHCDIGTNAGIHQVVHAIQQHRPKHVWLSPPCGPYSVMQNVNQRTPEQRADLEEKRRLALRQYVGCSLVFSFCVQQAIHSTWEWSQSCQAWRLPLIQRLVHKYQPWFAITRGCRVNLTGKHGMAVSKGWKIMTTNPLLARRMEMPCQCPKKNGACPMRRWTGSSVRILH